jgi:PTS system nitrogen regulatory IIA component
MAIQQLLSTQRVLSALAAPSKQGLLERLSTLLTQGESEIDAVAALRCMVERERLGSTGIGDGVALPHGRLKGLKHAVGAFVTLEQEIDYDALDRKPVRMAFALLVPEGANQEHLLLLRELATVFSNKRVRDHLLHASTPEELYRALTEPRAVS